VESLAGALTGGPGYRPGSTRARPAVPARDRECRDTTKESPCPTTTARPISGFPATTYAWTSSPASARPISTWPG